MCIICAEIRVQEASFQLVEYACVICQLHVLTLPIGNESPAQLRDFLELMKLTSSAFEYRAAEQDTLEDEISLEVKQKIENLYNMDAKSRLDCMTL